MSDKLREVEMDMMHSGSIYLNKYRVYGSVKNGGLERRVLIKVDEIKTALGLNKKIPKHETVETPMDKAKRELQGYEDILSKVWTEDLTDEQECIYLSFYKAGIDHGKPS